MKLYMILSAEEPLMALVADEKMRDQFVESVGADKCFVNELDFNEKPVALIHLNLVPEGEPNSIVDTSPAE